MPYLQHPVSVGRSVCGMAKRRFDDSRGPFGGAAAQSAQGLAELLAWRAAFISRSIDEI